MASTYNIIDKAIDTSLLVRMSSLLSDNQTLCIFILPGVILKINVKKPFRFPVRCVVWYSTTEISICLAHVFYSGHG